MLSALLCALPATQPAGAALELWLHLVPEVQWRHERFGYADFLPAGRVALYREGAAEPELRAALNEEIVVPEGRWTWIAEAPGWVGWEPGMQPEVGTVVVDRQLASGPVHIDQRLARPAVPACRVRPVGDWGGLRRPQVASLSRRVRLPVSLRATDGSAVPAGWWFPLGVDSAGVPRLGAPRSCGAGDRATAPPPREAPSALPRLLLAALLAS